MKPEDTKPANWRPIRFEVVEVATGDRFGNHDTYAAAFSRAQAMRRNWHYKKTFVVEEREP